MSPLEEGKSDNKSFEKPQDRPPVFNRWSGWYWLVFLVMAAQVLLYLFITRSFS